MHQTSISPVYAHTYHRPFKHTSQWYLSAGLSLARCCPGYRGFCKTSAITSEQVMGSGTVTSQPVWRLRPQLIRVIKGEDSHCEQQLDGCIEPEAPSDNISCISVESSINPEWWWWGYLVGTYIQSEDAGMAEAGFLIVTGTKDSSPCRWRPARRRMGKYVQYSAKAEAALWQGCSWTENRRWWWMLASLAARPKEPLEARVARTLRSVRANKWSRLWGCYIW